MGVAVGFAALAAVGAGVMGVGVRSISARLSLATTPMYSTLVCYIVGCLGSGLVMLFLGQTHTLWTTPALPWWGYISGVTSMVNIILANIALAKVASLYFTMMLFVSQALAGVVIDALIQGTISRGVLVGALLVGAGLIFNLFVDKREHEQAKTRGKAL